jgi:hypothetical protein
MWTKVKSTVPAMLFAVVVVASGSASAQNPGERVFICPTCAGTGYTYVPSGFRSPALQRLQKKLPADAFGSVGGARGAAVSTRGRPFETDPDPNIRFEMNRDDFDRRHNGG